MEVDILGQLWTMRLFFFLMLTDVILIIILKCINKGILSIRNKN